MSEEKVESNGHPLRKAHIHSRHQGEAENFGVLEIGFASEECQLFPVFVRGVYALAIELLWFVAVVVAVVAVVSAVRSVPAKLAVSLFAYICVAHT